MTEGEVFKIDGSKVWLSPTALEYAREFFGPGRQGVRKMAEHLLLQQTPEQIEAAHTPPPTAELLPDAPLSSNVEDRRGEHFVPDKTMQNIWGQMPHDVAPHAQTFGVNPLSAALGFRDIGQRPAPPQQPVFGPTQPQLPAAFYKPPPFIPGGGYQ